MKNIVSLLFLIIALSFSSMQAASISVQAGNEQVETVLSSAQSLVCVWNRSASGSLTLSFSENVPLQWQKYSAGGVPVDIPSATTSSLQISEGDQGYTLMYQGQRYWIWVVDYPDYLKLAKSMTVAPSTAGLCDELILNTQGFSMNYYTPGASTATPIDLQLLLKYNSMKFNKDAKAFMQDERTVVLSPGDNFRTNGDIVLNDGELPLMDTKFSVTDRFSRTWNLNNVVETAATYSAVRVAVEVITEHDPLRNESNNMVRGEDENSVSGSAPFDIKFTAYANKPIANYFSWSVLDSLDNKISASTDDVLRISLNSGVYKVNLTVSNAQNSCQATYTQTIDVSESGLLVPNAFSPNGDDRNDEFKVAYKSLATFKAWIFNRWGVQLFYWTDPAKGWDGKVNGRYVAPGAYFYVIEAAGTDGVKYKKKGAVNVFSAK